MLEGIRGVTKAVSSVFVALTFVLGLGLAVPQLAHAQHKSNADDMEVPTNDMSVVEAGKSKYAQRCSFCHGGDGHGGKGPCLSCAKFRYTGNTNANIYATIATGISNRSLGGTMGAFGTTMTAEEIISVITFLRWEEMRRIAAGEIVDPKKEDN
jgi:mono/diheme cytochrome c family protein